MVNGIPSIDRDQVAKNDSFPQRATSDHVLRLKWGPRDGVFGVDLFIARALLLSSSRLPNT